MTVGKDKIAIWVCLLVLVLSGACVSRSEHERLQAQYDSLERVSRQYERDFEATDSIINQMMSFFGGFNQLSYLISINDAGKESYRSAQKRIQDNVEEMTERMHLSQQGLDSLEQSLRTSHSQNHMLERLLSRFRQAMAMQQEHINLTQKAGMEHIGRIATLRHTATRLRNEVNSLNKARDAQEDEWLESRARMLEDMNRIRFCIGTASDLRELGVMKGRNVTISQTNFDYFTESDARLMHDLELMSSKAKLHSIHPTASYEMRKGEDGLLTLVIRDPISFWAYSRTLIVEVD